jgi:ATP-binding cassette, subfamily B, bacterial
MRTTSPTDQPNRLRVAGLLKPHAKALAVGLLAVIGQSLAGLLEPWPLKIIFDHIGKSRTAYLRLEHIVPATWSSQFVLQVVALGVVAIAILDAICSYVEKYTTTRVGQLVTHDLRRLLYAHVQRLSLSYHNRKQTGDLISRLTSDIEAVQSFIVSSVLDLAIDSLTLAGMASVMFT